LARKAIEQVFRYHPSDQFLVALTGVTSHNQPDRATPQETTMVALNGLEKFSHLEDKIYRTIELTRTLRQEKEELERQLANVREFDGDGQQLMMQVERLTAERELIRTKVEKILAAIASVDPEIVEAIR
jgi:hypothetical protein